MNNGTFKQEILLYIIIIIIVYYIYKLYKKYEPSIDIIIRNNKYEILLWYNSNNKDDENTTYEVSQKNITPKRTYKRIL